MAIEITSANFEEVIKENQLVVIDFGASWCKPCQALAPIIEELADEYAGKVAIGKCDIDEEDDITTKFKIRSVPTVVFIKNGEVVDSFSGIKPKATIEEKITAIL